MRETSIITTIISPAMQRHMQEINAQAHFLLILRPGVTKLDFIAVANSKQSGMPSMDEYQRIMDRAFADALEKIKQQGPQRLQELSNTLYLFELCNDVVTSAQRLAPDLKFDEQHIRAIAVRWLEEGTLSLGDVSDLPAKATPRWRTTPNHQAHLRFQDAIDWYAEYNCLLSNATSMNGERYKDYEEFGTGRYNNTILKIPMSASRPNIVTLWNLKVFLAEHLLAYDHYVQHMQAARASDPVEQPGLTFFFLPLKGLGQYRAAIDWVGIDAYKLSSLKIENQLAKQASTLQRLGLESLFTQSLIRSFSVSLRQAFGEMQEGESQSSDALYRAFADLWWANEVRFYKAGQLQTRWARAEGEDDSTWVTPADKPSLWSPDWINYKGSYSKFLATAGKGHPDLTYIKLSLSSFAAPVNDTEGKIGQLLSNSALSNRDVEKTIKALPFDEVLFACYFFQPLNEDLAEWVDQLGDSIVSILIEQTIQRTKIVRSRAKTLERAAHWLNGVMRSVGRVAAVGYLEAGMAGLDEGHQSLEALKRVSNSLQLMVVVEACMSLLRLYGTIDEGDYAHMREWFTDPSKAEWETPAAFHKYQASITHLVCAIGSARGHREIIIMSEGEKIEYTGSYTLHLDDLRFPPLSKGEKKNEPILALLPALTEPLDNALNYLDKKRLLGTDAPIRIEIEDHRHSEAPGILVNIGNPFFESDELPSTPGLARAQELMEFTGLATIGKGEIKNIEGKPYYFVPVHLHPQRLAERIDRMDEPNDAGWLCL